MNDELVICAGVLGFFMMLFGYNAFVRYLAYRETVTLAEKGLVNAARPRSDSKRTLRSGILWTVTGLALFLGWVIAYFSVGRNSLAFGLWALVGLFPMFFGVALLLIYYLTYREEKKEDAKPVTSGATEVSKE